MRFDNSNNTAYIRESLCAPRLGGVFRMCVWRCDHLCMIYEQIRQQHMVTKPEHSTFSPSRCTDKEKRVARNLLCNLTTKQFSKLQHHN